MKSKIKFEIHLSTNEVPFLHVTVSLKHGKVRTTLFDKPTYNSLFYLNTSSCHLSHVLKIISTDYPVIVTKTSFSHYLQSTC